MELIKKIKKNKVTKTGVSYTFGAYLLKGLGFITLPIFSRLMETSDYGIYNTFISYDSIFYLFVGLALHSSIKNAKYKFGDRNLNRYTSVVLVVPVIMSVIYLAIAFLENRAITGVLGIDKTQLYLLVIYSFCTSVLYIYQSRLVLEYNTKEYLGLSYFNALSSVFVSLLLVVVVLPEKKYMGRILGTVVPMIAVAAWCLYNTWKRATPKFNAEFVKYGLKISIPVIPHGIGQVILTSFDRIMITNIIGAAQSGLYSFAYTIYSIVFVAGNSLSTVIEPWAYEKIANKEYGKLKKISSIYVIGISILCAGTMLLAPEIVLILGSEKYIDALPAIPPVLMGGFFALAYNIPSIIEYNKEKTVYIALGTIGAAGLNIVLNAYAIPIYGFVAAAYTTLISYIFYYIFHTCIAKKLIGFNLVYSLVSIGCTIFLAIIAFVSLKFTDNIFARYSVGIFILLSCGLSVIILRRKKKI